MVKCPFEFEICRISVFNTDIVQKPKGFPFSSITLPCRVRAFTDISNKQHVTTSKETRSADLIIDAHHFRIINTNKRPVKADTPASKAGMPAEIPIRAIGFSCLVTSNEIRFAKI